MNLFSHIILFFTILIIYLLIVHQFKRSEDMEIYEFDYNNNDDLQTICDLKQPFIFNFNIIDNLNFNSLNQISDELNVKDINDYYNNQNIDSVRLPCNNTITLLKTDSKSKYYTEYNESFVEENFLTSYQEYDNHLKPHFTLTTHYDIITASNNTYTPLMYHTNYRHFILINSGKIRIKLTPWKSSKYLYINKNYDNLEFSSPIDIWNPQDKYANEMNKIKFIEIDILPGNIVYIPSYWWYSIQFVESETVLSSFTYNSIMNCFSNMNHYFLYYLQQYNTKTKVVKTITINDNEKEDDDDNESDNNTDDIIKSNEL
tara:strand:- start:237 stop:1184 length:948 start_codon:yes stop_codon:yes gene_type:complete